MILQGTHLDYLMHSVVKTWDVITYLLSMWLWVETFWVEVINMMYIFIHLYDICYTCYLLLILWRALVLCLGLEIIHWACDCSTPPFISFPPGVNAIGGLQSCILLCNSIRLCICTLDLKNGSVELCNSFLIVNVILCIVFHSICVCKAMWADHLIG